MQKVSIVGCGRFGKTLQRLLHDDFEVSVFGKNDDNKKIYEGQIVFYAVPIEVFENVIKTHRPFFTNQLLIDVLSVKLHAKKVFDKYLKNTQVQALLTHPLFGPDSSKNGFTNLPIVIDQYKTTKEAYDFWKSFFTKKGLRVVEISADTHDKLAAQSQGTTHFFGRLLEEMKYRPTTIDTLGAKKLYEIMDQTCNDTWQLFLNLQNYNPYTKKIRIKIGKAYDKLYNKLLPSRVNKKFLVFGIQGGKGSFNEAALLHYVKTHNINKYKVKYLFTTEKVLKNLHEGSIDFGQFAIHNAIGGVVQESTYAMARYKFKIVNEFAIQIQHFLMKRKDVDASEITTIITHPQVLKQCATTLRTRFGKYILTSGKGDMVDHAKAAFALVNNKLPKNYAVAGPKQLAKLYNLDIIAENLQDDNKNFTSFFMVKR